MAKRPSKLFNLRPEQITDEFIHNMIENWPEILERLKLRWGLEKIFGRKLTDKEFFDIEERMKNHEK